MARDFGVREKGRKPPFPKESTPPSSEPPQKMDYNSALANGEASSFALSAGWARAFAWYSAASSARFAQSYEEWWCVFKSGKSVPRARDLSAHTKSEARGCSRGESPVGSACDRRLEGLCADEAEFEAVGVRDDGDQQHAEPRLFVDLLELVHDPRRLSRRETRVDLAHFGRGQRVRVATVPPVDPRSIPIGPRVAETHKSRDRDTGELAVKGKRRKKEKKGPVRPRCSTTTECAGSIVSATASWGKRSEMARAPSWRPYWGRAARTMPRVSMYHCAVARTSVAPMTMLAKRCVVPSATRVASEKQ